MCAVNWAPGTVAVATVQGVPNVRVFKLSEDEWAHVVSLGAGIFPEISGDPLVTDVRPLVVLDPEDRDQMVALHETLSGAVGLTWHGWPELLRAVLTRYAEAQTKPPKPPEPRGRFAVVRDQNDSLWVRLNQTHWYSEVSPNNNQTYGEIDAVEVVREGLDQ